jgi:hypothetical protein
MTSRLLRWLCRRLRKDESVDDCLLQVFLEIAREVEEEIHLAARPSKPPVFADRRMDSFTLGWLSQYIFDRLEQPPAPKCRWPMAPTSPKAS